MHHETFLNAWSSLHGDIRDHTCHLPSSTSEWDSSEFVAPQRAVGRTAKTMSASSVAMKKGSHEP
eukprot:2420958-Amphidinium_carterae.2